MSEWSFRDTVVQADRSSVREIVRSTGFFSAEEIDVAEELVREHLLRGEASGYLFVIAETGAGAVVGYACFGPTPCTARTHDLYWIAVREEARGHGVGLAVLRRVEARLLAAGGGKLVAETSSRDQYASTRAFYTRAGFAAEARIRDYYAPGEDIVYFTKMVE